jgi:hypothetical protein
MSDVPDKVDRIGEHQYKCVALMQSDWESLGDFLAESLGGPIATLVRGYNVAYLETLPFIGTGGVGMLFAAFSKKMSRDNAKTLRQHMAKSLYVMDGEWKPLPMDAQELWWAHNRGELAGVIELFFRSQYSDFFDGLLGLNVLKLAKEASRSRIPTDRGESSPNTSEDETPSAGGS